MELVAVILAGETSDDRFNGAKKLLDYGFANYKFSIIEAELKEKDTKLKGGVSKKVKVKADDKVDILLEKNAIGEIKRNVVWNKNIKAPIKKGDILGCVEVYSGDTQIGQKPITADENIKKLTILVAAGEIFTQIFKL